jgi:hypothetical protein
MCFPVACHFVKMSQYYVGSTPGSEPFFSRCAPLLVVQGGRPTINDDWRDAIKETLRQSFDVNAAARPTMQKYYNTLRLQLIEIRDGDATDLERSYIKRRRSHISMLGIGTPCNQQEQRGRNFRQVAKGVNAIMSAVKPSASLSNDDDDRGGLPRKSLNRLRNKLRESLIKE